MEIRVGLVMAFSIIYSPEAVDHLAALPKDSQKLVLDEVERQLATTTRRWRRGNGRCYVPIPSRHGSFDWAISASFTRSKSSQNLESFLRPSDSSGIMSCGSEKRESTYESH